MVGNYEMETDSTRDQGFRISSRHGLPVVTPPAEIDFRNAPELEETLELASTVHPTIIVDMRANRWCDSSGIRMLVRALKRAQTTGGELRLVIPPSQVRRVFKATGVDRVIKIFGTLAEAVAPRHD